MREEEVIKIQEMQMGAIQTQEIQVKEIQMQEIRAQHIGQVKEEQMQESQRQKSQAKEEQEQENHMQKVQEQHTEQANSKKKKSDVPPILKRVRMIISYDGTNYCGWQVQINGITVEEVINKTLRELLKEDITIIGASRTDSGVHAMGNVAVFDTTTRIPAEKISFALNQRLPDDIVIQESCEVPLDWHPRYQDCSKTYEYKIYNNRFPNPCVRFYSHFVYYPLDVEKMQQAANILIGEHDFKSFSSKGGQQLTSVREIYELDVTKVGDMISIKVRGNGFLYNMVRIIAGTLMKVGLGVYPPEHVKEILDACDREMAGPKAPARGLTLLKIDYENEIG